MRFRTTIELGGKTATGMRVPPEVVAALGPRKRVPVRVTIGPHTYRSTIAPYGGAVMLPLSAENREAAGVAAGDEVDVDVVVDDAPREVALPTDLSAALTRDARAFFDGLSYTNRQRYVTWVESAKKVETRQARVKRAAALLAEGKTQY
jgi:hypothetical protein